MIVAKADKCHGINSIRILVGSIEMLVKIKSWELLVEGEY